MRDSHGTFSAGVVGMEKGNKKCGVGVAYNAFITGQECHSGVQREKSEWLSGTMLSACYVGQPEVILAGQWLIQEGFPWFPLKPT